MIRHWIMLKSAAVPIGFLHVVGMVMRRTLSDELVTTLIAAHKSGLPISPIALEVHTLAGGNPADLVKAALTLAAAGVSTPIELLGDIARKEGRGLDVAKAYLAARELDPSLEFDEVADRYMKGEDIISAAQRRELRPLRRESGWSIRFEYGPLDATEARELLRYVPEEVRVTVRKPGTQEWVAPSRFTQLLT
jgi:uncharacterized protein YqfA (UPF0365 family)